MSVAKVFQAGAADQLSPSIWRDCRMSLLNDLGLGYFIHEQFHAVEQSDGLVGPCKQGDFQVEGDAAFVVANTLPVDLEGGRIDIETDGDDEDGAILFAQAMAQIVPNSGQKVWLEAMVALGAAADQGFFVGFAEEDGLDVDIVADEGVAPGTESQIGFVVLSGDTTAVDAIYQLDGDTHVTVLADVSNSTPFTNAGGTAADFPVADVYHKFGMRFDGRDQLQYFFDGHRVATVTIDTTIFPNGVLMGPAMAIKNHSGAAVSMNAQFFAAAYQKRT